jgi:hypothetical protein
MLLGTVAITQPYDFIADAYYAAGKIVRGLLAQSNHLITRVRSNAVAFMPYPHHGPNKRGRPRIYGRKVKLKSLLNDSNTFESAQSPVYGERNVTIQYRVCDLLWRPAGQLVRFVAVLHPSRGACLLMCTDLSLSGIEIIRLYGLRFKIELSFKQAVRLIGSFAYHFWMKDMKPRKRRNGNQHLHRESPKYRDDVKRKIHAYHVFMQAGVVAQGLLQYLAVAFPELVWNSFGSWLRTIRPGIPPLRARRRQCATQHAAGISLEFRRNQFLGKIHHRATRSRQNADVSPRSVGRRRLSSHHPLCGW